MRGNWLRARLVRRKSTETTDHATSETDPKAATATATASIDIEITTITARTATATIAQTTDLIGGGIKTTMRRRTESVESATAIETKTATGIGRDIVAIRRGRRRRSQRKSRCSTATARTSGWRKEQVLRHLKRTFKINVIRTLSLPKYSATLGCRSHLP